MPKTTNHWREHLDSLIKLPDQSEGVNFLRDHVSPGLGELYREMKQRGLSVQFKEKLNEHVTLTVNNGEVEDFMYEVRLREFEAPAHVPGEEDKYCRAEVFLHSGGQNYDVFGYTSEQIVADAITQYEKHVHFLHLKTGESLEG